MKIGIIGAGEMGGTLVRKFTGAGHLVKMTNSSGISKLQDLAKETGAVAVAISEVVKDVDVIILAIPLIAIPDLPKDLFANIPQTTVIVDTTNYYPIRDGKIDDIENGMPESVWVSGQIQRPVIKAYNTILAGSLAASGLSPESPSRLALPLAGDHTKSKELVARLISDTGFDPFDHGTLQDSWEQQPGSPVYCTDLPLEQLKISIAKSKKDLLPARRELGLTFIMKHDPALWREWWPEFAQHNRIIYESE